MKKKIIVVWIIILLILVGLSGCNEQSSKKSSGVTKALDIMNHANKYINKTVILRGMYVEGLTYYTIWDGSAPMFAFDSDNVVKPTPMVHNSEYKFTGIVRYGNLEVFGNQIHLEVTKIEIV